MQIYKNLMILRRLLPFLWVKDENLNIRFLFSIVLVLVSIIITAIIPLIFKSIVALISNQNSGLNFNISLLLISYGCVWMISQMINQFRHIILLRPLGKGLSLISLKLFQHLHSLPIKFHLEKKTGAVSSIITKAQESMPNLFWAVLFYIIPTSLEILIATVIIWYYYGLVYVIVLISIVVTFIIFTFSFTEKVLNYQHESNEYFFNADAHMVDSLSNFMSIKYFGNTELELLNYKNLLTKSEYSLVKFYTSMELIQLGQGVIIGLGLIILTIIAGINTITKIHDISDFVMINGYVLQFSIPLNFLGYNVRIIKKGFTDLGAVLNILDIENDVKETSNPHSINRIKNIQFNNVSFSYSNKEVLKDINFKIPERKTIAIIGATGSGKSTITNLLFRFYDITQGEILFDNIDIKDLNLHDINKLISIIPQDITLFNTTIYENILYANPNASKLEFDSIIEATELKDFIQQLPEKGDTIVGKSGLKLSGGERQRIAIARGIIKKASLYILDEATSSLDVNTETKILKNLKNIKKGSTFLIIAHRLSTIKNADTILVFKNGKIIESGNHLELVSKNGIYFNFWNKQNSNI